MESALKLLPAPLTKQLPVAPASPKGDDASAAEIAVRNGREAWNRIKRGQTWADWVAAGRALVIGRDEAMRAAHTNEAKGRRYNEAFSQWLAHHEFADMDGADRSRLFDCMAKLGEITNWRDTLTVNQRNKWNHPATVWAHFRRPAQRDDRKSAFALLKESVARLEEENRSLRERQGNLWSPNDKEDDIVRVLFEEFRTQMAPEKCERIARKLARRFAEVQHSTVRTV